MAFVVDLVDFVEVDLAVGEGSLQEEGLVLSEGEDVRGTLDTKKL